MNGFTVNRVEFGDDEGRKGTLQQVGRKQWVEDSIVAGQRHFAYAERRRDEWSVYLHDTTRDVSLQIDVHTRELKYGSGTGALVPIYQLRDASRRPHGRMVNRAEIGHGDTATGALRQVSRTRWEEVDDTGRPRFSFSEADRDDWSVYLHDAARDVALQLDLHTHKVLYAVGGAPRTPLYDVLEATDDVNGWLVNLVEVGSGGAASGRFAQVDTRHWVETGLDGGERFRFDETARDDWSVYLHDRSRDVYLQIDLFTGRVGYHVGSGTPTELYDVVMATDDNVPPEPEAESRVVKGPRVNRVEFGSPDRFEGVLRQVDGTTWVEDGAGTDRGRFSFNERRRDEWSVYLHDPTRNVSLQIDLHRHEVLLGAGTTTAGVLGRIRSASDEPNGWLTTEVMTASSGAATAGFRKVDWTTWVEVATDGRERFEFTETARDDWSVYLHDPDRELGLQLDLYTKEVKLTHDQSVLYRIASGHVDPQGWRLEERISSRSQLTQTYRGGTQSTGTAFRTTISVSPHTRWVDLYATEECVVSVRGQEHRIDRVRPVRVSTRPTGKVVVNLPVSGLSCPTLCLHTNLMKPGTVHLVTPDADAHKKVLQLPAGELARQRRRLGVPDEVTPEQLDGAQQVVQELVGGIQYAYNVTPTGVQHDRAVRPGNLGRPAFSLDLSGQHLVTGAVDVATAAQRVARAVAVDSAQQTVLPFGSLLGPVGDLLSITVSTGVAIGDELVGGITDLADQGGKTFDTVGERIVAGDFEGAGRELIQGGEQAGRILNERGKSIGVAADNGARDVVLLVLETTRGELKRLEATVDDLLDIGRDAVVKLGVAWDDFVAWLADTIDWDGVLEAKRGLEELMRHGLEQARAQAPQLRAQLTLMMGHARASLGESSRPRPVPSTRPSQDPLGEAFAELDSFLDQVMSDLVGVDALDAFPALTSLENTIASLGEAGQRMGTDVLTRLSTAGESLAEVMGSGAPDPEQAGTAVLDVFRSIVLSVLDLVQDLAEVVLEAFGDVVDALTDLLRVELRLPLLGDLYSALTKGERLTLGGLVALLLAIPVTAAHRAATGRSPVFSPAALTEEATSSPAALVQQEPKLLDIVYAVCHGAMTIYSPAALEPGKDPVSRGVVAVLGLINLGFTAVAYGCGVPKSREPWTLSRDSLAFPDLLEQPEYQARAIWSLQGIMLGAGVLDWAVGLSAIKPVETPYLAKITHNALAIATGGLGVIQAVWACQLDGYDATKFALLDRVLPRTRPADPQVVITALTKDGSSPLTLPGVSDGQDQWVQGLYHYHAWAGVESRRTWKLIENLSDALPTVAILATAGQTTPGIRLAQALSVVGHASECAIHAVRTGNNELY